MYLLDDGVNVPLELTEKEYDACARMVRKNRVEGVENEIARLVSIYGTADTKTIIRDILKKL